MIWTELRTRAQESRTGAESLSKKLSNVSSRALYVIGHVTANILDALADIEEFKAKSSGQSQVQTRRQQVLERMRAIRNAAAGDNWDEFDKLAGGILEQPGDTGAN